MSLGKKKMLHQAADSGVVNTENFNTVTYQGNNSTNPRTNVGFQPDLVWIKNRDNANDHFLTDSVRGAGEYLVSNSTDAEDSTHRFNSFDSNGFTVSTDTALLNNSSYDYVAWCWKAGGAASLNEQGSIDSQVSANPDAGFSIVKYTGNNTAGATVGHGLSSAPEMVIVKGLDNALNWIVYHTGIGATKYIQLNTSDDAELQSNYNMFNSTAPSSTAFTLGNLANTNSNTLNYIAYCFHSVDGYQKVGSYAGNTSTLPSIDLGFEPRWVMIKEATDTGSWLIYDSVRPSDPATQNDKILFANDSASESTSAGNVLNFTSTGFDIEVGSSELNTNGNTYIYLAIA